MTPQEKAKELVEKYRKLEFQIGGQYDGYLQIQMHDAKECALIAVEEAERAELDVLTKLEIVTDKYTSDYWQEVKQEIEKI